MRAMDCEDLAASEAWAEFSSIVRALTGMPVVLFTPSRSAVPVGMVPADLNPICTEVKAAPGGLAACLECNREHFAEVVASGTPSRRICHVGLIDIALPVRHGGRLVAIISTGQLLAAPASASGFEAVRLACRRFGIAERRLKQAYDAAPCLLEDKVESVMALLTFFAEYLCEMSMRIRDLTEGRYPALVRKAIRFIEEGLAGELTLEGVAEAVDYSPGYLGRRFKEAVGVPFSDYVRDLRLARAKELLARTRTHIADVAFACGFGSLSQFNRAFVKTVGCTPRAFRRGAGV
jgi:AraC-like DNA-binding protein/ligand-binding sensor protein